MSALVRGLFTMLLAGAGIISARIAFEVFIDPAGPQAVAGYGLPYWLWVAVASVCFVAAVGLARWGRVNE